MSEREAERSTEKSSEDQSEEKKASSAKRVFKQKRHSFLVSGTKFDVDVHYSPIKPVGTGAYGVVCSALNKLTNKQVAIKKITSAFQDLVDAKRILREMKLLRHFNHENVVSLKDLINPVDKDDFEDVYMVFEYMQTDLHKIIYSKNDLTDEHCQYFAFQILRGLRHIHAAHVLHRDLKPSNLLLNGNCDLKICDFGLARGIANQDVELTEYVVTRWYRAPEIMCACQEYDAKIDVWSIGCILAELILRKPLFPGDDYIHQLNLIFGALGTPTDDDLDWISNEKALQYILSLPKQNPVSFERLLATEKRPRPNPLAVDLIRRMLVFNPRNRISVEEALNHPYIRPLNVREDSPLPPNFDFSWEKRAGTKPGIQSLMLEEIGMFRPDWYRSQFGPFEEETS
eukprot:TRINITY_DN874_c0_g1_i1.p1 TRINITY_DN874_c0_g1~~TRINITY_DN874_c0_g1_i1.p1  ORF type:complete len:400 (-),score=106.06 TRINITY_DN874_c0_g1_i1:395-1594(-)